MKFTNAAEVEELFPNLSLEQMWAIVFMMKHVRLRCRNNVALNNYLNMMFPDFKFRQVDKVDSSGNTYKGLVIRKDDKELEA